MTPRFLGLALLLGTGAAFAQQAPAPVPPVQNGFFRPAPDVSLTNPRPPVVQSEAIQQQATQQVDPTQAREVALEPPAQPDAVSVMRWTEEQMDRSALESERARQQSMSGPPPINGAFDGTTSERNR